MTLKLYSVRGFLKINKQRKIKVPGNSKKIAVICRKAKEDEFLCMHLQYKETYYDNLILGANPSKMEFPNLIILVEHEENNQILPLYSEELAFLIQLPLEFEPSDNYYQLFPSHY